MSKIKNRKIRNLSTLSNITSEKANDLQIKESMYMKKKQEMTQRAKGTQQSPVTSFTGL